jgi:hypothetical protein
VQLISSTADSFESSRFVHQLVCHFVSMFFFFCSTCTHNESKVSAIGKQHVLFSEFFWALSFFVLSLAFFCLNLWPTFFLCPLFQARLYLANDILFDLFAGKIFHLLCANQRTSLRFICRSTFIRFTSRLTFSNFCLSFVRLFKLHDCFHSNFATLTKRTFQFNQSSSTPEVTFGSLLTFSVIELGTVKVKLCFFNHCRLFN